MTTTDDAPALRLYLEQRHELVRQRLLPALALVLGFVITYAVADGYFAALTLADLAYYTVLILGIAAAIALIVIRPPAQPVRHFLLFDAFVTLIVASRLLSEETSASGTALVLTLKVLFVPLIMPLGLPQQAVVVASSVGAYAIFVAIHAERFGAEVLVHEAVGLPLAGLFSLVGVWAHDRTRWTAFLHGRRLEESEERLRSLLGEREGDARVAEVTARAGQAILAAVNRPGLLERLARETAAAVGADFSHVLLHDEVARDYWIAAGWGDPEPMFEEIRLMRFPQSQFGPVADRVRAAGVVHSSPDSEQPLLNPEVYQTYGVTNTMLASLQGTEDVRGFLGVGYRARSGPFNAEQERILRGIAQFATLGIANARLFEDLERASRVKADFVASMSHELRTPLNVIIGYQDLLAERAVGPLTEAQQEILGRLQQNSRQLLELIEATLDLSRLEAGEVRIQRTPVDVGKIFETLRREVERIHPEVATRFTWDCPADVPTIASDPTKLRIIVRNLVTNAVKFSADGPVSVSVAALDDTLEIRVADRGIGIAPEAQAAIFEPFRQADTTIGERFGGVGLGLHIVRRLVDMLGGTIDVESRPGEGATFRVRLPGGDR